MLVAVWGWAGVRIWANLKRRHVKYAELPFFLWKLLKAFLGHQVRPVGCIICLFGFLDLIFLIALSTKFSPLTNCIKCTVPDNSLLFGWLRVADMLPGLTLLSGILKTSLQPFSMKKGNYNMYKQARG